MNIAALKEYEGQEIKNYKALCEILGIEPKAGNTKKAQMKEIERYCKLSNGKGYRLVIDEIYDKPKEKQINRRNDVYGEMLELAIMDYLIKSKRSKTTTTKNYLLGKVEMINQNYKTCNSNRSKFAKYINVNKEIINDFFNISGGNFRRILERSLDNLEDRSIIKYKIVTIISYYNDHRLATDEEVNTILESEKEIMNQMGYDKKSEVRVSGKWNIFKNEVKNNLHNKDVKIDYYYSSYEISVNKKFIRDEREKVAKYIIDESQRIENRDILTDTLTNNLVQNADNRQEKARKSRDINEYNHRARATFTYVEDIQKIIEYVINPYSKRITQDIVNVER